MPLDCSYYSVIYFPLHRYAWAITRFQKCRACLTPKEMWRMFYGQSQSEGWNNILITICPVVQWASVLFITLINGLLAYTMAWQVSASAFVWKQSSAKAQCPRLTPQSCLDVVYSLLTMQFPSLLSLILMSEFAVAVCEMIPDGGQLNCEWVACQHWSTLAPALWISIYKYICLLAVSV